MQNEPNTVLINESLSKTLNLKINEQIKVQDKLFTVIGIVKSVPDVSGLNNKNWTRGDLRRLKRMLTSLISPFKAVSDFDVNYSVPGREKDIADLLEANDILSKALWTYDFIIDEDGSFSCSYKFNPPSTFKELASNIKEEDNVRLQLLSPTKEETLARDKTQSGNHYSLILKI